MFRRSFIGLTLVALAVAGAVELTLATVEARDGDLRVQLTGAGGSGSARFRSRGSRSEFQVEAERLKGVKAGDVLTVAVDGVAVGKMTVTVGRSAQLELSSERRQTVPAIVAGSIVSVLDKDGNILMTGAF